jgi:hypothetical protein
MVLACSSILRQRRTSQTSPIRHRHFQSPTQRIQRTRGNARYPQMPFTIADLFCRHHKVYHCSRLWSQKSPSSKSYLFQPNRLARIRIIRATTLRIIDSNHNGHRRIWIRVEEGRFSWSARFHMVFAKGKGGIIIIIFIWHC